MVVRIRIAKPKDGKVDLLFETWRGSHGPPLYLQGVPIEDAGRVVAEETARLERQPVAVAEGSG